MQTRSFLQRRTNSESSDRLTARIQTRPWSDPLYEQPEQNQSPHQGYDLSNIDLFSHDPGPRDYPKGGGRSASAVQAKLTVGAPNDHYEQEADRVADQVINMPDSALQNPVQREVAEEEDVQMKPLSATITPLVQRESAPEEEELQMKSQAIQRQAEEEELQMKPLAGQIQRVEDEEELQMKPLAGQIQRVEDEEELQMKPLAGQIQRVENEEELQMKPLAGQIQRVEDEEELQMKSSVPVAAPTTGLENRLSQSKSGGSPLPENIRSFMEPRFGADFSQVRVHTSEESVQMNQDLNAQAFTHGQDIYFGAGKSPSNDGLTAHELTHVVQQTGNSNINRYPIQRDGTASAPPTRDRRGAMSRDLGTGAARLRNLAEVRQMSPEDLSLEEPASTKSRGEEIADTTVEGLSPVTELASDVLGDDAIGSSSAAIGGDALSAVTGIMGLYSAIQQVGGEDINEKIEGIFGLVGGVASGVETGAELAKTVVTEGSNSAVGAEMAAAVGGTVGEGIEAVKGLVLTIKGVYDAYKDATSEEGSSTKEKISTGLGTVRGLVEAAGKAVSAGKTIVDLLQQASGGLAQAVPGLSIALSAVNIAIEVFNIIKAKTSEKFVKSVLATNRWEKANVFGKGKERRQQQATYADTYAEEIQKMKVKLTTLTDPQKIAELESLIKLAEQEHASLIEHRSLTTLAEVNSDRTVNSGFAIGVEITKVVGDVLSLVPEPNSQVAGMSLKAAAAGASIGKSVGTKVRQFLRDKAEKTPGSFLNKVVDTTQSTNAKLFRQKETAKYIFSQVAALPTPQSPEFIVQKDRVEQLIEAAGISPQSMYRTARSSGLEAAIQMLVKAQGE